MKHEKKIKVVILATDKSSSISVGNIKGIMEYHDFIYKKEGIYNNHIYQHLYFLSDEEIKIGDYVLDVHIKAYYRVHNLSEPLLRSCKKIITTTNLELNLPRPSNSFIQKFIEEYNKGNVIEEVMVEYDEAFDYHIDFPEDEIEYNLKVASDNTITIKPVVETWNDVFNSFLNNHKYKEGEWRKFLRENYNSPTKKK